MTDLHLAPISNVAWAQIDAEATATLERLLAARTLVDLSGPLGWEASAIGLGRTAPVDVSSGDGVESLKLSRDYIQYPRAGK